METTVVPILNLLAVFKRPQNEDLQLEQIYLVMESTLKHSLAILQGERENENIATDEDLEAARGKAVERCTAKGKKSIHRRLLKTLRLSMAAVAESQGLGKLEEALHHLTLKFRYDINVRHGIK